ncbi:MAG TPA: AAA family ATPase, partial [Actinomycetota bacterium]|nr:AAA family ATPase [Actinomycetota bacterium]
MGEAGGPFRAPDLLIIVGPPAVGKMSVGREIARRTGYRLFHNHMSIEPVLQLFDYGHPSFGRLVEGFRRAVFEEVAQSDLPGLIFTFVWAFNLPSEADALEERTRPFR